MFYLSTDSLASYASNGSLEPYAADLENADAFFPSLREAFTYDDEFWCAPKDFSTLALVINTSCGTRPVSPTPTSPPTGTAARGGREADQGQAGRPGVRS